MQQIRPPAVGKMNWSLRYALAFDAADQQVGGGANAPVTLTLPADANVPIVLAALNFGYQGTGTIAGTIQITDSGIGVVWGPFPVPLSFNFVQFNPFRQSSGKNTSLAILLSAGGSGLTGIIQANCYKLA